MTTDNSYHIGRYTLWQPLLWVRQFFWLFPLGASFLSCTVGKNYQQPTLDMPDSFRYAPGKDTSGLGKMSWADFFQDPVLRDLIDSGIHHNYDLELAINNMDRSRQLLLQSKAGNQPQAYLQFGVTSDIPSKNSLNGLSTNQFLGTYHVEDYNASLNISWEADIWGKIRRRKQAALADYMASWEARKAVQTQLVADIASAYYNLLMLDAQLNVAKRSVALDDSTLRIIRLEFKAGQANALAVEQANAQRRTGRWAGHAQNGSRRPNPTVTLPGNGP